MSLLKEQLDKDLFVLILGHGRSGTSLCTGLLNQSHELNIALEYNNNEIGTGKYQLNKLKKPKSLSYDYNGNKVVLHHFIHPKVILECLENNFYIFHDRWEDLRIIFTRRDPIDIMISRLFRMKNKGKELPLKTIFDQFVVSDRGLRELKRYFIDYHVFDFDKAVDCDLHIKWLFDYVGVRYLPIYRDAYSGVKSYQYGSLRRENIMFGRGDRYIDLRKEIEDLITKNKYWPWASLERL